MSVYCLYGLSCDTAFSTWNKLEQLKPLRCCYHIAWLSLTYALYLVDFHNTMNSNLHSDRVKVVSDGLTVVNVSQSLLTREEACSVCQDIKNLEQEADEASKTLANALTKLTNAKTTANYAHGTILGKLPNEIISLIFCATWDAMEPSLPERSDGHEEPQEERKLSIALILAGVCRRWRAVALSLPQIWSDVHIFLHRQIGDKALAILRDIVARSKHVDLTIRLYSESVSGDKTRNRELQLALAVLQKESARWRSVQMCMPY
ncbi:hypothetical protein D9613_001427 [Agrocybe pediades]|uniref:F-box domain-containing protein n=1 Tax=Agrocybe pediades TaxID=84607 RepID=A0A8H4R4I9_9AGAR|nr:hypothetical protein D9613_001427 [Agrocybe pediades]